MIAGAVSPFVAQVLIGILVNALYFGGAYYFGERAWSSAVQRAALEQRTAELEREREVTAAQAVALDRVRIARELHDVVAHHVSVMGVQAGAARVMLDSRPRSEPAPARRHRGLGPRGDRRAAPAARHAAHARRGRRRGDRRRSASTHCPALTAASEAAGLPTTFTVVGDAVAGAAGHAGEPVPHRPGGAHQRAAPRRTGRRGRGAAALHRRPARRARGREHRPRRCASRGRDSASSACASAPPPRAARSRSARASAAGSGCVSRVPPRRVAAVAAAADDPRAAGRRPRGDARRLPHDPRGDRTTSSWSARRRRARGGGRGIRSASRRDLHGRADARHGRPRGHAAHRRRPRASTAP